MGTCQSLRSFLVHNLTVHSMKYLKLILAANFGNTISLIIASFWFPFDPISPNMMVLQNLLYDLGQLAIPLDNVDAEYLSLPHQLSVWDLSRFIIIIGPGSFISPFTFDSFPIMIIELFFIRFELR